MAAASVITAGVTLIPTIIDFIKGIKSKVSSEDK
jgi:hypothetical protein